MFAIAPQADDQFPTVFMAVSAEAAYDYFDQIVCVVFDPEE
jgi:hypothetical protein